MENLITASLYQMPEGVLTALAGLGMLGIRQPVKGVILLGVVYGLSIPILRLLGFPYGVHTILALIVFVAVGSVVLGARLTTLAGAWILAAFLISLGEQLVALPLLTALNIDPAATFANPWLHVLWGWIGASPLLAMTIVVVCTRFVVLPAPEAGQLASRD